MRAIQAVTIAVFAAMAAVPVWADMSTPTVNHWKAKRLVPPKPGTKRFITIQIDPAEQQRELAAMSKAPWQPVTKPSPDSDKQASGGPSAPKGRAKYAWYWQKVSPKREDRAGRFESAVAALSQGPQGGAVRAPRLADLAKIAQAHGTDILKATIGTEVSPALVLAMISVESGGNRAAVSHAGAVGLMQLIPATADRFDVADSTDPAQNISGGVTYLNWLMKEFDRDPLMVIAAYNSGENNVKKNDGVPPFAETRDYVPKVLAAWAVARGLCLTPPELVSDGCVFRVKG
ncbi:lytic transglycosylase domain-containing protein [Thioclava sp.]|uniref:lytic transglycosylase domain-containing protein n=1 Tax=Thioclava sp. TaxID=1933450 RepID=UPI003AA9B8F8